MILLCLASIATAQDTLESTWARLAAPQTVQASFRQTQHRQMLSRPLHSTGQVAFARPDKVRWAVDTPTPSVFLMIGPAVSMRMPALGVTESFSLEDRPELVAVAGALTVWLQADLAAARQTYTVTLEDGRAVLVPRGEVLSRWVSQIALDLSEDGTYVSAMSLIEPDGDRVDITFSDVRLDDPVDSAAFELR